MKRIIYTVLASAAFLAMLTGTSKKRKPREAGSIPSLTIPATTGWARTEVAGIAFVTPPNATVTRAETLDGIRITLPSGFEVRFEAAPITLSSKHDFHMYHAPDAQIVLHEMSSGDHCQTFACSSVPILGYPLCVTSAPRTNEECTQIVAMVRSIQPL
ncbi:MAG: hypothetical protein M4D80_32145 [Myxococcota bacterium]|nr:hypothetical protein [Deltaproteobacteria bacterium]MDQ3339836.1 hypothetical protein [Myxococcota bacterium]